MAQLVLGAVGAGVAGFLTGWNPTAMQAGFAIGSSFGGPKLPTIEGPRLTDLKVQSSNYGDMLPIVFGTARLTGKMIWSKPILETRHSETAGGKGGGGQEVTSYTYSQTFAIAICEGPIAGIRRIWANGELIYNVASDADAQTIIASNRAVGGIAGMLAGLVGQVTGNSGMVIYLGSETQTPDATIQADVGVANCPAYRGTAYVVFNNLQLEKYGNRTPNLEFEICTETAAEPFTILSEGSLPDRAVYAQAVKYNGGVLEFWEVNWQAWNPVSVTNYKYDANANALGTTETVTLPAYWGYYDDLQYVWNRPLYLFTQWNDSYPVYFRYMRDYMDNPILDYATSGTRVLFPPEITNYYSIIANSTLHWWGMGENLIMGIQRNATGFSLTRYPCPGGVFGDYNKTAEFFTDGHCNISYSYVNEATGHLYLRLYASSAPYATGIVSGHTYIARFNADLELLNFWDLVGISATRVTPFSVNNSGIILFPSCTLAYPPWFNAGYIAQLNDDNTVTVIDSANMNLAASIPGLPVDNLDGVFFATNLRATTNTLATAGTPLSTITSSIATRVGLVAGDLNVTALTDNVDGYVIGRRMTARAALEPLMGAFYFDGVESDAKIKFVKRGGASAVSIVEDDLAGHQAGDAIPDPIRMTRGQEMDLPREITVSYIDSGAAYQTGTQYSRRLITSSQNKADLQFAIAMSAAKAKQISDVALFTAWAERNSAPLVTDRSYAFYEPTDIITVTQGNVSWIVRLTQKNERDGMIEWQAVAEEQAVYTQAATAAALPTPTLTVGMAGPTQLTLLDIPLLRDQDDGYGFYLAVSGYLSGWTGAQGYKSNDNEQSWQLAGDGFFAAATQGYAATALGNFTGGNIFDESSSVSVVVNAALAGTTELAVLNGANAILIGDEVLQFKNATLTATNTYTLSGFLRGRRGTEWAMSTHVIGDRVVLLTSTSIYRMPNASAELNLERDWRAVSFGTFLDEAETVTFTDTGVGLECYSPVQIGGGRDAANNLTINWKRRTRIGGEWRDYVEAALGETVESYEIDIYSGAAVVRTITAATNTASYSAANQTTDGLTPGNPVVLKIYQLSSAVGRGYPGSATV